MAFLFGNFELENNIFLAPMAGVTDLAFRSVCHSHGCALSYTEMVSAKALAFESEKTRELMKVSDFPSAVQIFGHEKDAIAYAAKEAGREGLFVDINMGCPAKKIVSNSDGCALMKNPRLAGELIRAAVEAAGVPVSVKMRLGWDDEHKNAVELAKIAEDAGAFAVCVHARTRERFYSGRAETEEITKVKEAVNIPVVANGDIFTPKDAKRVLDETGADAVMIGRGAMGNPWIFERTAHYLKTGEELPEPTAEEKIAEAIRHVSLLCDLKGGYIGVREGRRHSAHYIANLHGAARARERINSAQTLEELKGVLTSLCR